MTETPLKSVPVRIARVPGSPPELPLPVYGSALAAGMDLHAAYDALIEPGMSALVPTGLIFEIPAGYELQIRPRSGLAAKNAISIANAPGTVDADYRGEVKVILINHGHEPFRVHVGDRIAQGVVAPVTRAALEEVQAEDLIKTDRGQGGFGSTGVR